MSLSALAHQLIEALDPDRHIEAAAAAGTDDPTRRTGRRRPRADRPRRPAATGRQPAAAGEADRRSPQLRADDRLRLDRQGHHREVLRRRHRPSPPPDRVVPQAFIDENRDQITALQVLYDQPHGTGLTYADVRELARRHRPPTPPLEQPRTSGPPTKPSTPAKSAARATASTPTSSASSATPPASPTNSSPTPTSSTNASKPGYNNNETPAEN